MSDERKDSVPERSDLLQQAFDAAAGELDLKLEPAEAADPRCIGVAFFVFCVIPFVVDDSVPDGHADDQAIEAVVHGIETLTVAQLQSGAWSNYAINPHVSVTHQGLAHVNQAAVDAWLASPEFQQYQQEYPPKSPRDVHVSKLHVVYTGLSQATATYRVTETFANGKVTAGNGTVVLARIENVGWRVVVNTKGGREEQHHGHG